MKLPKIAITIPLMNAFFILIGFFLINFPEGVFKDSTLSLYFNTLGAFIIAFPVLILIFVHHRFTRGKEYNMMRFLRNISDNTSKGADLSNAMVTASQKQYGAATLFLNDFYAELSKGVPMHLAFINMSREMGSNLVSRMNATISDVLTLRGSLPKALPWLVTNYMDLRVLKERKGLSREAAIIKGYMVFVLFLLTFLVLVALVIPSMVIETQMSSDICRLKVLALFFILLQSIYGGLAIGKLSEGTILAGAKHSVVQIAIASLFIRMFLGINLADMFLISAGLESTALLCG